MRTSPLLAILLALAPLAARAQRPPAVPPFPDSSGWGTPILALGRDATGTIWAGTYGAGIYVLKRGATAWEQIRPDSSGTSISSDFVHAFAFGPAARGRQQDLWYGTIGNGWGLSRDGGRTWENWDFEALGPRWLYVAPNGMVYRGDTLYVATADGLKYTWDHGVTWGSVTDSGRGRIPDPYVLTIAAARDAGLWVSTLKGLVQWRLGAGYEAADPPPIPALGPRIRAIYVVMGEKAVVPLVLGGEACPGSLHPARRQVKAFWQCSDFLMNGAPPAGRVVREFGDCGHLMCAGATSSGAFVTGRLGLSMWTPGSTPRSRDVYAVLTPPAGEPGDTLFGTACGFLRAQPEACLATGDTAGVSRPAPLLHSIFARPIAPGDQPYIDQTYRYGATMGGAFQQHQGVEFNDPVGTPVHAIGAGMVVYAGRAERGALTVAIRHDTTLMVAGQPVFLYSTYYHNSRLLVRVGQRVTRGQEIALVGSTGRATNPHLHLEVHVAPSSDVAAIVDSTQRFPPYTVNPELWIEPLPGTGVVAGQVWDSAGRPVSQARIYGLVKPEPQETPFLYAETYGDRAHPDPVYQEHFAVGDVPPGEYDLGVTIDGRKVLKHVVVEAGKLTWVEFRPETPGIQ
jgi:murein DD-endopeptidase MepM/ murein hydrolase activator NlpD